VGSFICKAASGVCSTECPPAGGTGVIADTTSCNKYYLCNGAGQVELYCPSERPHFNGVTCVNDPATCCKCQRETCAGDMFELLADPQNCHSYYACLNIDGGTEFTPQGPYQCDNGGSFINGACDDKTTECENACDAVDSTTTPVTNTTVTTSPGTNVTSTTTATIIPGGCIDPSDFTCPKQGFYARCPDCDPSYFNCKAQGSTPTVGYCTGDLVFNPVPVFPYCIKPENCPFEP
ncbi:unnamed protein product, partial [Meganyctiphanes norvegica]